MNCLLCNSPQLDDFFSKKDKHLGLRAYMLCKECDLVFLKSEYFLNTDEEKERYSLHENDPKNPDYVSFLSRLTTPLLTKLNTSMEGLDFGCGPGPAISSIFEKEQIKVFDYDPIYFDDKNLLGRTYDFITCTETVEHFYNPRKDFCLMNDLLNSKGSFVGIMTQFRLEPAKFKDWWYHREPTHVCFYSRKTFEWIAEWLNWKVEELKPNIVIYSK